MKSVVICSGGMDSATALYLRHEMKDEIAVVSFDYGQRHSKELECAAWMAADIHAPWTLINLPIGDRLKSSSLTNAAEPIPEGHYAAENMRSTVVPNRNAMFLSIAFAIAVDIGAKLVVAGFHAGDHPIYPDCRPAFVKAFDQMERIATEGYGDVRLDAPFVTLTKADIVRIGTGLKVPFEHTWSCYNGLKVPCGKCGTCVERAEAFALNGLTDPLVGA